MYISFVFLLRNQIMFSASQSRRDINRSALVLAVEALGDVSSPSDFVAWTQTEFNRALPHGAFMACIGRVFDNGIQPMTLVSSNCPDEYMRSTQQPKGIYSTFRMQQWMQSGKPQLFDLLRDAAALRRGCIKHFRASGLQNIAAHGMYDVTRQHLSFFSFHQLPHPPRAEQEKSLKMIVPAMHAALMRCLPGHSSTTPQATDTSLALTGRETEVLSWIRQGKTNVSV